MKHPRRLDSELSVGYSCVWLSTVGARQIGSAASCTKFNGEVNLTLARKPWSQTFVRSGWELCETQASSQSAIFDHECEGWEPDVAQSAAQRIRVGLQVQLKKLTRSRLVAFLRARAGKLRSRLGSFLRARTRAMRLTT